MSFLDPSGPFGVGSITTELADKARPAHLLSDTAGRRLWLKLWYPAERGTGAEYERIWQELRSYYRLGVRNPPVRRTADLREMEIKILRKGVTVRARRAIPGR